MAKAMDMNEKGFETIVSSDGLINRLKSWSKKEYICHYTNANALNAIIRARKWYVGNPFHMNDGLEYDQKNREAWKNIFFVSLVDSGLEEENIGMWSMYGQPWEDGVCILIPRDRFTYWIESINKGKCLVHKADPATKKEILDGKDPSSIVAFSSRVAYYDSEALKLKCGRQENIAIFEYYKDIARLPACTGYIKDIAWEYEKELRLRIELSGDHDWEGLLVDIPDEVLGSLIVKTSPRYAGKELEVPGDRVKKSKFQGKLDWVYCDSCPFKNKDA